MKRLFVSIPLSIQMSEVFTAVQEKLQVIDGVFHSVAKSNLHLTLFFFGRVDNEKEKTIHAILKRISSSYSSFEINLEGIGVFPSLKEVHTLWAGTKSKEILDLMNLFKKEFPSFDKKNRKAVGHLTIARVKKINDPQSLLNFLEKYKEKSFGTMKVDQFVLYESALTAKGAIYREVESFEFKLA